MPKGRQIHMLYYDNDNYMKLPCGFYIQGRKNLIKMKLKLHTKNCDNCNDNKNIKVDEDYFNSVRPITKVSINKITNPKLRACDRPASEKITNITINKQNHNTLSIPSLLSS